jgi:hypothetical protein
VTPANECFDAVDAPRLDPRSVSGCLAESQPAGS